MRIKRRTRIHNNIFIYVNGELSPTEYLLRFHVISRSIFALSYLVMRHSEHLVPQILQLRTWRVPTATTTKVGVAELIRF